MKKIAGVFENVAYEVPLQPGDLKYTTILHGPRNRLGLTCNEYCVADTIHCLASNPGNKACGWCYASKQTIGNVLGLSKQTVHSIIKKLISDGLIEKHGESKNLLKATSKWYRHVQVYRNYRVKNLDSR